MTGAGADPYAEAGWQRSSLSAGHVRHPGKDILPVTEAQVCTKAAYSTPGTCYLRLGRGGEPKIHDDLSDYKPNSAIKIKDGSSVAIFSTGAIFEEAKEAVDLLLKKGIDAALYTFPFVKPLDEAAVEYCAEKYKLIVTAEEHNTVGGFGSAVAEVLSAKGGARLLRIGLNDKYSSIVGTQKYLRQSYGMDGASIAKKVAEVLEKLG